MRVTLCGTGQSMLNPQRAGAAIVVEEGGRALLLDCGPGSLERLAAAGIPLTGIEAVWLSHLHFDHALGIAEWLTRLAFAGDPLPPIYGPRGTADYVESAAAHARTQMRFLSGGRNVGRLDHVTAIEIAEGDDRKSAGMRVRSVGVPHSEHIEAQARRVTAGGRSLVYGGDCRPAPEILTPFARGADVLIHECYSEAALRSYAATLGPERGRALERAFAESHTPVVEAARIAAAAGVKRLVLTHLLPTEDEAELRAETRVWYSGDVTVARDGLALEV